MSISNLPALDRTAATFRDDVDTFFASSLPAFTTELNTEISRINTVGAGTYSTTSTTSLTVGTGSKSLTVETGKSFVIGQPVMIASTATPTNYMVGQVTAYDSVTGAMTVNVTTTNGSGTVAAWTVAVSALGIAPIVPDSIVELTSGTSWTCPAGVTRVRLRMVGAGGSGGRGSASNSPHSGGGGGAGLEAVFAVTPGNSYSYAIGAGGTAITSDNTNGNAGGSTTFTANSITYTANGGIGGRLAGVFTAATASGTGAAIFLGGLTMHPGLAYDKTAGGESIFGPSGGYGNISGTNSGAGYDGKIILELYK